MKLLGAGLLVALAACGSAQHGGGGGGALMTGAITAPDQSSDVGVEVRAFGAFTSDDPAIPNAYGVAVRQLHGDVARALQWGWAVGGNAGSATYYARLMFDVVAWERYDGETHLSAFSPTADVGIAPFGHGICVSASAGWDVHFGAPDRALVGVFAGLCGGKL